MVCLCDLGVAFLKAVEEGTYDAVIVDSSDPIGRLYCKIIEHSWSFTVNEYVSN